MGEVGASGSQQPRQAVAISRQHGREVALSRPLFASARTTSAGRPALRRQSPDSDRHSDGSTSSAGGRLASPRGRSIGSRSRQLCAPDPATSSAGGHFTRIGFAARAPQEAGCEHAIQTIAPGMSGEILFQRLKMAGISPASMASLMGLIMSEEAPDHSVSSSLFCSLGVPRWTRT